MWDGKVNKELKDKWIEALESGKYRKRIGAWTGKGGQRCCLAVLAELTPEFVEYNGDGLPLFKGRIHGTNGLIDFAGLSTTECWQLVDSNDEEPGYPIEAIKNLPED
jgi:hypothetical protein